LTFWPQNLISSSLSRDAPVTKVWRKSINRYWRYRGNIKLPRDGRTHGRTHGRTTRKHIASAGAYRRRRLKNWKLKSLAKQKSFQVTFKSFCVRKLLQRRWQSVPCSWCGVGKGPLTGQKNRRPEEQKTFYWNINAAKPEQFHQRDVCHVPACSKQIITATHHKTASLLAGWSLPEQRKSMPR